MAWPSNNKASTQYTDQDSDLIANARPEINKTIENQNSIIDHLDIANANDGDIMRYNGTSGVWETLSGASIQQQSLYVPMGAFAVNTWYQDSYTTAEKEKYWQKCLLGGSYMNRGDNNTVVSQQAVYGSIEGAQVVRDAHTENTPSDRQITATNVSISLTSGVISYGSSHGNTQINHNYNYHKYSTFSDNYIGLPAGDYRMSFLNETTDGYLDPDHEPELITTARLEELGVNQIADFVIYNQTAGTDIETIQMTDLRNEFAFFTLTTDSQIELYNRGGTFSALNVSVPNGTPEFHDEAYSLHFNVTNGIGGFTRGYIEGAKYNSNFTNSLNSGLFMFPQKTTTGADQNSPLQDAPSRLGWITPAPQRYIRIDKL
jgi:hypothetical protein